MTTSKNADSETATQELPRSVKNYMCMLADYHAQARDLHAAYWQTIEARGIALKDLEASGIDHALGFPFMHVSTNLD